MGLNQLDVIRKQIESTVKNRVAGETAKIRKRTSLIGEISRLTGKANQTIDDAAQEFTQRYSARRAEIQEEDGVWLDDDDADTEPVVCADGYVRRSPVQPLRTPSDYYRRLLLRAMRIVVVVLFALAVLWLLVRYSVLSI